MDIFVWKAMQDLRKIYAQCLEVCVKIGKCYVHCTFAHHCSSLSVMLWPFFFTDVEATDFLPLSCFFLNWNLIIFSTERIFFASLKSFLYLYGIKSVWIRKSWVFFTDINILRVNIKNVMCLCNETWNVSVLTDFDQCKYIKYTYRLE